MIEQQTFERSLLRIREKSEELLPHYGERPGFVFGNVGLGYYRDLYWYHFRVVHLPSGEGIFSPWDRKAQVEEFIREIAQLADWTRSTEEIQDDPQFVDVVAKMNQIASTIRGFDDEEETEKG